MAAILDWLDHAAEEMTEDIALGSFVNCVEVDRAEGKIYVDYAFDKLGNGFSPSLATEKEKSEHLRDVRCSPSYPVVETKGIEPSTSSMRPRRWRASFPCVIWGRVRFTHGAKSHRASKYN